jgi:hypothetical protein
VDLGGARVALPERVPGFVVEAGRAAGHDLPALDVRESLAPWREAIGGKGPFFVRIQADDLAVIAQVRRISSVGELWLEAPLGSIDHALDLLVAGAARLVVPIAAEDSEMLEAIGPSALVAWDGRSPWPAAQAAALEHGVPVLATHAPPDDAACDTFLIQADGRDLALVRVASAPTPPDDAKSDDADGETE